MAFVDAAYYNLIAKVPSLWANCDFNTNPQCGQFYNGQLYWIGVVGGSGFLVGFIRWLL